MIFENESQFHISKCIRRKLVWHKSNQQLQINNMRLTIKYNGETLIFIHGIFCEIKYLDILKQNLINVPKSMSIHDSFKFYQ